jgi:hypothetical protein
MDTHAVSVRLSARDNVSGMIVSTINEHVSLVVIGTRIAPPAFQQVQPLAPRHPAKSILVCLILLRRHRIDAIRFCLVTRNWHSQFPVVETTPGNTLEDSRKGTPKYQLHDDV